MATKAELTEELSTLRAILAQKEVPADQPASSGARHGDGPVPETPDQSPIAEILAEHGLAADDLTALWEQLSHELEGLPQKKPLLTALGAFSLGFVLGRMSK